MSQREPAFFPDPRLTHAQLVERAERWLLGKKRCNPVFTERGSVNCREMPDAYGINPRGSIVVECKVSRADFAADQRKEFRKDPALGLGVRRFYMVEDALDVCGFPFRDEMAPGWGILEVRGRSIIVVRESDRFTSNGHAESVYMRSRWLAREREFTLSQQHPVSSESREDR